jgi:Cu-processing system ATP-binding protein
MLETRELKKSYGKLEVLKGISIRINPGLTTAILGPNGSGKTTLIKCILGQVHPDRGEILFKGQSIKGQWLYRNEIGYLPQTASFPENLRVKELVTMVEDIRGQEIRKEVLISLLDLGQSLDKKVKFLSGGTRQKVNLLLTFMFGCPLYVLDEPTSGLDPVILMRFKEFLRELKKEGITILLTTHIMSLVEEMAEEVIFILEGKVYFTGKLNDLLQLSGKLNLEQAIAGIMMNQNV